MQTGSSRAVRSPPCQLLSIPLPGWSQGPGKVGCRAVPGRPPRARGAGLSADVQAAVCVCVQGRVGSFSPLCAHRRWFLGGEDFMVWETPCLQMSCHSAKRAWNGDFGRKAQAARPLPLLCQEKRQSAPGLACPAGWSRVWREAAGRCEPQPVQAGGPAGLAHVPVSTPPSSRLHFGILLHSPSNQVAASICEMPAHWLSFVLRWPFTVSPSLH